MVQENESSLSMNCAKCSKPKPREKQTPFNLKRDYAPQIRLVKTDEEWKGERKYKCPRCNASFWFPVLVETEAAI